MKGPHFFEKRKKEMARQEKLKQKAERKAQRKAEKDKGEGGDSVDDGDEFGDVEAGLQGESGISGGPAEDLPGDEQAEPGHGPPASDADGQIRST